MRLVQIANGTARRVALVEEPELLCMAGATSVYELVKHCLREGTSLTQLAKSLATGERLGYDEVYSGRSAWRLMTPIDIPGVPSRVLVSGTGLTHLGSARERQAMHLNAAKAEAAPMTDSMRMFQWGVERGRPSEGEIGIAPEWFYKGDGSVLRGPFEALEIPGHAEDGGEEAELAGIYFIDDDGAPHRVGMVQGNEFSDHKFERRNYLNLAGSKLRACSIGPELVVAAVWQKKIATGEENMCHSLANLEHHHFKFAGHRQPGSVHVHFYGADALSFGDGVVLQDGDVADVRFEGFGRALRNPVRVESRMIAPVRVGVLG
jgi:hypothetical protein